MNILNQTHNLLHIWSHACAPAPRVFKEKIVYKGRGVIDGGYTFQNTMDRHNFETSLIEQFLSKIQCKTVKYVTPN